MLRSVMSSHGPIEFVGAYKSLVDYDSLACDQRRKKGSPFQSPPQRHAYTVEINSRTARCLHPIYKNEIDMSQLKLSSRTVVDAVTERRLHFLKLNPFLDQIVECSKDPSNRNERLIRLVEESPQLASEFLFDENDIWGTLRFRPEAMFASRSTVRFVDFHVFPMSLYKASKFADRRIRINVSTDNHGELGSIASLLRVTTGNPRMRGESLEELDHIFDDRGMHLFNEAEVFALSNDAPLKNPSDFSGVLRLQHASVLVRHGGVGILLDPHLHSRYSLPDLRSNLTTAQVAHLVDAIAITHSHGGHYNLSTVMMFPLDTPILITKVTKASLICDDIASDLRILGFTNVIENEWYGHPVSIGSLQIFPLPFYGKQPSLKDQTSCPELRNWGSTYLIKTPTFLMWALADSGNDRCGAMQEVADHVFRNFGAIDLVISSLATYSATTPRYVMGSYEYWLALTPEQRNRFDELRDDALTLEVKGVADVCQTVEATYFWPYTHWWGELGGHPRAETKKLAILSNVLRSNNTRTSILDCGIGHLCEFVGRNASVVQHLFRS